MDLSKLSDSDLMALKAGDLTKVSDAGLSILRQQNEAAKPKPEDPGALWSTVIGAGRTTDRVIKGVQQAYYTLTGNDAAAEDLKRRAADDDAAYKPLQEARPYSTGLGEAVPSMLIPAGGSATLVGNAARMAAAGAIPGALEYGTLGERADRAKTGAIAGALVPVGVAGARTLKAAVEPMYQSGREAILSRVLNRAAGDDAANVISKLKGAAELVPGSAPTAAQVAENGGIAGLERAAAQADPQAYATRAMQQSAARAAALDAVAKTPQELEAAIAARGQAVKPLYEQAASTMVPNTPEIAGLLQRMPNEAVSTASRIAKVQSGAPINVNPATPIYTGRELDLLKKGLDDVIGTTGQKGIGKVEGAALADLQSGYLSHLDANMPGYQQARDLFAKMSGPINEMQVAQALRNKVAPALRDYGARTGETAAKYAEALKNSEPLVEKATGLTGKTVEDVVTPKAMKTFTAVAEDLARKTNAENIGRGVGSDTFQKLAMNNIMARAGMPAPLTEAILGVPGVATAAKAIYPQANEKMAQELAQALLDPRKAAELMQKTSPKILANNPRLRNALAQSLMRPSLAAAPVLQNLTAAPSQP